MSIHPDTRIGVVTVRIADRKRSLAFYGDVLGMKSLNASSDLLGVDGMPLLRLIEQKGAVPRPPRSTGLYHFAVLTPGRMELGNSFKRLMKTGYPMSGAADHLVSEALYLSDPDKNGIEIYRDRPKDEWTFEGASVRMANDPVDLDSLFREAEPEWHGLSKGTTMGHIHLHVRDLQEAEQFYCGVLGFDVMLRWQPSALFISAGGYHHHIGLNTWAGVGSPPPPKESAGLEHFEIVLPNSRSLNEVLDRVKKAGVTTTESDGGVLLHDPSENGIKLVVG